MSGYLLDTNACIAFINQRENPVKAKILEHLEQICLCDIVQMELYYGAYKSQYVAKNLAKLDEFFSLFPSLGFNHKVGKLAGKIRANLAQKGTPIGAYDVIIASTALFYNKTLITHNVKEFQRVDGLLWEDWQI